MDVDPVLKLHSKKCNMFILDETHIIQFMI